MPKPRRKNPGFNSIEDSPQGRLFMGHLMGFLGDELSWKALEQTREKSTVFLVGGSRAWGVLVETVERAEEDRWVHRWGFRYYPGGADVAVQIELLAHRWDPWLHAELTGDRSILDGPRARRYKLQERRDWEIGRERDQYRLEVLPRLLSQPTLCGVSIETIDLLLNRYAKEEGAGYVEEADEEAAPADHSGSGSRGAELLLRGDFPVVD